MSGDVIFSAEALQAYVEWQAVDRKIAARINALIKDIQRNGPMNGIGKPEVLKHIQGCYTTAAALTSRTGLCTK
jgi:toxin YoeB